MRRRLVVILAGAALGAIAASSCVSPTKITLDIRTDVACALTKGTAISAGVPGVVESAAASVVSPRCSSGGEIGTVVLTPASEADEASIAVKVVLGVDVGSSACTAANQYKGCIVQRRLLTYLAHVALDVPIEMLLVCRNVPCDEASTCAETGQCVSARIDDPRSCEPPRRCLPDRGSPVPNGLDAATDANAPGFDPTDAQSPGEGAGDGSAAAGQVGCGPRLCDVGQVCCVQLTSTACIRAFDSCPGGRILCDGPEDCPGTACCYYGNSAECAGNGPCTEICHHNEDCTTPGARCISPVFSGQAVTCSNP